jgi:hypothetical protein
MAIQLRGPGRGWVLESTAVVATDAPERYAKQLLAHIEDVLGRHLERFGARRELVVTWQRGRPDGAGG